MTAMRYTTLGTDVLDTSNYDIIATAKTDELAKEISRKMNAAAELKAWKDAAHEACIVDFIEMTEPTETISKLIEWNVKMALDPAISKQAHDLVNPLKKKIINLQNAIKEMADEVAQTSGLRNEYQDWDKFWEVYETALKDD